MTASLNSTFSFFCHLHFTCSKQQILPFVTLHFFRRFKAFQPVKCEASSRLILSLSLSQSLSLSLVGATHMAQQHRSPHTGPAALQSPMCHTTTMNKLTLYLAFLLAFVLAFANSNDNCSVIPLRNRDVIKADTIFSGSVLSFFVRRKMRPSSKWKKKRSSAVSKIKAQ